MLGAIALADDSARPLQRRAAPILEEEHIVRALRRRHNIQVAVGVHIERVDRAGITGLGVDVVRNELGRMRAVVLHPGDAVVNIGGDVGVHVAVAVEVGGKNGARPARHRAHHTLGKCGRARAVVLVPENAPVLIGGDDNVIGAVAVHVNNFRPAPLVLLRADWGGRETGGRAAVVRVPNHVVLPQRDHIGVAVAVKVARRHMARQFVDAQHVDIGQWIECAAVDCAVVEPNDLAAFTRCRQHIEVAVPVQVGRGDIACAGCRRLDDEGRELGWQRAVAAQPAHSRLAAVCRITGGRPQNVGRTVAVKVGRRDELGVIRIMIERDLREGGRAAAAADIPANLVAPFGGVEHVKVAVAFHVSQAHRFGEVLLGHGRARANDDG